MEKIIEVLKSLRDQQKTDDGRAAIISALDVVRMVIDKVDFYLPSSGPYARDVYLDLRAAKLDSDDDLVALMRGYRIEGHEDGEPTYLMEVRARHISHGEARERLSAFMSAAHLSASDIRAVLDDIERTLKPADADK